MFVAFAVIAFLTLLAILITISQMQQKLDTVTGKMEVIVSKVLSKQQDGWKEACEAWKESCRGKDRMISFLKSEVKAQESHIEELHELMEGPDEEEEEASQPKQSSMPVIKKIPHIGPEFDDQSISVASVALDLQYKCSKAREIIEKDLSLPNREELLRILNTDKAPDKTK